MKIVYGSELQMLPPPLQNIAHGLYGPLSGGDPLLDYVLNMQALCRGRG